MIPDPKNPKNDQKAPPAGLPIQSEPVIEPAPGQKAVEEVVPKSGTFGNFEYGDPDEYEEGAFNIGLPDDLPAGTYPKKYVYHQANRDQSRVTSGLVALLGEQNAWAPVTPQNHPEIDPKMFTNGEIIHIDVRLIYMTHKAYKDWQAALDKGKKDWFTKGTKNEFRGEQEGKVNFKK